MRLPSAIALGACLLLTPPVAGQETPEELAEDWETAFLEGSAEQLDQLLAAEFQHESPCGLFTKEEEVSAMSSIFSQPGRFDIVSAQASFVGEGQSLATLTFEYPIRYTGDGDLYPEVQGQDILQAYSDDSGFWRVIVWREGFPRGIDAACTEHLVGVRQSWLSEDLTIVGELSLGQLKSRHGSVP